MLIVNTDYIENTELKTLGIVKGNIVKIRDTVTPGTIGLNNKVNGEEIILTEVLNGARNQAIEKMISEAEDLDADAIINVRFSSSNIRSNAIEIIAYGTAVKIL